MDNTPVITGLGAVTPIGPDVATFWSACVAGRTGLTALENCEALPVKVGAPIADFDPSTILSAKEIRRTARHTQFAYAAACEALADSGLPQVLDKSRAALVFGNAAGNLPAMFEQVPVYEDQGWEYCDPFALTKGFSYMSTMWLAVKFAMSGPTATVVTACTAGTEAIIMAAEWVRMGRADFVLAGAAESWLDPI